MKLIDQLQVDFAVPVVPLMQSQRSASMQSQRSALRRTKERSVTVRKSARPARTQRSTLNLAGREPRYQEERKCIDEVKHFFRTVFKVFDTCLGRQRQTTPRHHGIASVPTVGILAREGSPEVQGPHAFRKQAGYRDTCKTNHFLMVPALCKGGTEEASTFTSFCKGSKHTHVRVHNGESTAARKQPGYLVLWWVKSRQLAAQLNPKKKLRSWLAATYRATSKT